MPSMARRLTRRYLPHRIRTAALELIGRRPTHQSSPSARTTKQAKPAKPVSVKKSAKRRTSKHRPVPAPPFTGGPLVEVLRRGGALPEALVAETRKLLAQGQRAPANAVACALEAEPSTAELGALLAGIVAAAGDYHALAWSKLRDVPEALWTRYAAREFARSGLNANPDEAVRRIADLAERAPAAVPAGSWLELIGPAFGYGDHALVTRLFELLDAQVGDGSGVDQSLVVNRDWLRPWVAAAPDGATAQSVPEGSVSFAIMDYGHPGRSRASANIGDHVQSVASLGHLARHQNLSYDGPQDLVDLMTRLRGRVRPELARSEVEGRVQLLQIDRDASMYSAIPPDTWTLAFGWYMHAIFESRYGFPFHPNLLPIFISFHCSKRELLTEEAIAYLIRFGPIGCRDWTTVDILSSVGVPAFFSGCLTTTVRTVFPDPVAGPPAEATVAYVDMPPVAVPAGAPTYAHSSDAIRFRSFATNVGDAIELLETYRQRHSGLVTIRLHCYLPARSLGVPVDFQPNNRSDPRFAGLIDITDAEFATIQTRIDTRLEQMIGAITSGASPDAAYELWRRLNADDVAAAQRRRVADRALPPTQSRLVEDGSGARPTSTPKSDTTTTAVVVPVPRDSAESLRVLISSAVEHAGNPMTFFLLARDPKAVDVDALPVAQPHQIRLIDTRGLGDDLRAAGRKLSATDRDLLAVPDLVDMCDRAVVVPAHAVVSDDLTALARLDLGGHLVAATDPAGKARSSGFAVLNTAANRLRDATAAATELRRRAYARHRFDFDAFDTSVFVLDLGAWRERGLTAWSLPYVQEFGLTYRELLHLIVGPDRFVLDERWHTVPGRSAVNNPALTHWSEPTKPWSRDLVPDQQRWYAARNRSVEPR